MTPQCDALLRYKTMMEALRPLVLVIDRGGKIVDATIAWKGVLGYEPEELIGSPMRGIVHPFDWEEASRALGSLEEGHPEGTYEARYRSNDGCYRRLAWTVVHERTTGDVYAIAHDITELRAAERIANEARARAVEASRVKSQFLANMSHEIRTPMNGVLGMLSLALETSLDATQREYMDAALASAEGLLAIIDDILDISKIEAGKIVIEKAPFDVRKTVDLALKPLAARARHKGLAFEVHVDSVVPARVSGDSVRFRQVLLNLVGNALKFTSTGSITVVVDRDSSDGDSLRTRVTDTGCGIALEKRDRIFEPFTQADESTTRQFGGTGLGLTISRQLATLMGGHLSVTSEVGRGSTFEFTAACPSAADVTPEPAPRIEQDAATTNPSRPLRVLLAEDNDVNAILAKKLLARLGCVVHRVADGIAALEQGARDDFDLVFMDVQMPGLDGFEVTRRIRRAESATGRHVPIMALTANAMDGDERACTEAGMDGYLSKPIDRAKLDAVVVRTQRQLSTATARPLRPEEPIARASPTLPPPRASVPPIDWKIALEHCIDDEELLHEIVVAFLGSWKEAMDSLQVQLKAANAIGVTSDAHRIKGALLTLRADASAKVAAELEAVGRSRDLTRAPALLSELTVQLDKTVAACTRYLETPHAKSA